MTGLAAATGRAGDPPTPTGSAIVDQHAAALLAMGVLAALHHRERTGEGQKVEITMVLAGLDLQLEPIVYKLNGGDVQRPREALGSGFHEAPYGLYQTADGYIALSLSPLARISAALGDPEELRDCLDPAARFTERERIRRTLGPLLTGRTSADLLAAFQEHGVWCAPVNDYDTVFDDPVVAHVDPVLEIDHPPRCCVIPYGTAPASPPSARLRRPSASTPARCRPSWDTHRRRSRRRRGPAMPESGAAREIGRVIPSRQAP